MRLRERIPSPGKCFSKSSFREPIRGKSRRRLRHPFNPSRTRRESSTGLQVYRAGPFLLTARKMERLELRRLSKCKLHYHLFSADFESRLVMGLRLPRFFRRIVQLSIEGREVRRGPSL